MHPVRARSHPETQPYLNLYSAMYTFRIDEDTVEHYCRRKVGVSAISKGEQGGACRRAVVTTLAALHVDITMKDVCICRRQVGGVRNREEGRTCIAR